MEFTKYNKIKVVGDSENKDIFSEPDDEIVIEEKIDGSNFRFMIHKGNIIFGSRTQTLSPDIEHNGKSFERCINHVQECFNNLDEDIKKNSEGKIFYGENCVKHTMSYDWNKIPIFLGFDILSVQSNQFLSYKNKKNLFDSWNLSTVPLIKISKVKEIIKIDDSIVPESKYYSPSTDDKHAEGIVFKNYDKQIFAKYIREKFKEKNRKVFGGNKKYAKTDDEYFSLYYCTNARIDKCIFKLINEDKKLDMTLMGDLLNMVYRDIWEENWEEIAFSKKTINLSNFKKLISKRCLEVLKQTMINNSLQNGNENRNI